MVGGSRESVQYIGGRGVLVIGKGSRDTIGILFMHDGEMPQGNNYSYKCALNLGK